MRPRIDYLAFAALRYWKDREAAEQAASGLSRRLGEPVTLICGEPELAKAAGGDIAVIIPLSGAVQQLIRQAAERYRYVIVYAAYIAGNMDPADGEKAMMLNAAPTVMDCWSVLRRQGNCLLALSAPELAECLKEAGAAFRLHSAKIILVGETEPWVISNSRDPGDYRKLGLNIEKVSQEEVANRYRETTAEAAAPYREHFLAKASAIIEPSGEDIERGARMAAALVKTMEIHEADVMALACFNLLREGTNCCLGVSYINECTDKLAACEGDLDCAATMLLVSSLTRQKVWMANPGIHPEGLINFSHCTAPLDPACTGQCRYKLRSHHESGIGTSLEVAMPIGARVTAARISVAQGKLTAMTGTSVAGEYEKACRTQCYIRFDDFRKYLDTALGCHQVLVFEDIAQAVRRAGRLAGLEVLG